LVVSKHYTKLYFKFIITLSYEENVTARHNQSATISQSLQTEQQTWIHIQSNQINQPVRVVIL
jgi:hypothetical protein